MPSLPVKSAIILILLSGCAPYANTPPEMADDLTHRFLGRPANEFFFEYGAPSGDFASGNGAIVYRWDSFYPSPAPESIARQRYDSPSGSYQIVDNYTGVSEAQYCELRVYTDPDNIIQKFAVVVDSMGKESGSRCSEIFNVLF